MTVWPTQAEVLSNKSVYGDPRGKDKTKMSAAWEARNIVRIQPPFQMTYAGAPITRGIRVHKVCAPALLRVFNRLYGSAGKKQATLDHWGVTIFGGVVMYRLMRGGNQLSIHSYGAAIDLDPARNGLYDQTPRFAQFPQVLDAVAAEGASWGADWNGDGSSADERRADGMHWQFTS